MARRNARFMRFLINRVIDNLGRAAMKHNTTVFHLQPKRQEVLDVTGPGALTKAAFEYVSKMTDTTVSMNNFTKMRKPKLVADILFLPINAFGAGHQVKWSGIDADSSPLVHHDFAGSWKTNHINGPTEEEKKADQGRKELEAKKKAVEQKRKAVGQRRIIPGRMKKKMGPGQSTLQKQPSQAARDERKIQAGQKQTSAQQQKAQRQQREQIKEEIARSKEKEVVNPVMEMEKRKATK
ncbi:MAG: hypothetical protein Q9186_006480 [Xanthomendoza sp. 1 TL-2023]